MNRAASPLLQFLRRLRLDRHLAPVLTAVMAGVVISTLVAYFYTKHTVENLVQGQIVQSMDFLDREVTGQVREMITQTSLMAQEEIFRLAMEDSYLGRSARVAGRRKLEGYVHGGAFDRAFLLDTQGRLAMSADPGLQHGMNLADRGYFQKALRGAPVLDTLAASRVTGKPVLLAASPLLGPDGAVTGVAVGLLHTSTFAKDMLNHLRIGQSGGAYILRSDGVLLATPEWAPKGFFDLGPDTADLIASASRQGVHRYMRQGSGRMCLTHKNETTGWVLVVEADESEVLAPATRLGMVSATISFLTLALVGLALGALRRTMTRLRSSEADQRTLTELSPVGIVTFNSDGLPDYMNRQARAILDLGPEDSLPARLALEDDSGQPLVGESSPIARVLAERVSILGMQTWYAGPQGDRKALLLNATVLGRGERESHGVVATLEDITERIRAVERLHESEERFSSLFRLSPDSIVLSHLDSGIIVDVNETFTKTHGCSRDFALGKSIQELGIYTDDTQRVALMERVKRDGHAFNVEVHGQSLSGAELDLSLSSQVIEIGDRHYRMTVARDIGERIRTERTLRENRRLLESILNTVPLSIFWKDTDSTYLGCNSTYAHIVGHDSPKDIIGKTDFDLPMTREECEAYRADDLVVMRTKVPKLRFVEPLTLTDDRTIWLETSKLPLLDDEGQAVGILGIFENITERINAERELSENRRLLESILNTVPMSIFWQNTNAVFLGCNQSFARGIGLKNPQEVIGLTEQALPVPEERKASHLADNREVLSTLRPKLRFLEPMPMSDGEPGWIEVSKLPLLDDAGRATGILGMFEDITERINAVEKLKQSEERFSSLFRLSPEPTLLIDVETQKIADANEAFCVLIGLGHADIVDRNTLELGFYADPAAREVIYGIISKRGRLEPFEFEARRPDGTAFVCEASAQSLVVGKRSYLLAMMRDVSEAKKIREMMVQTEKMISVGGIAAGIAHEINNPLGIVLQAAQNLVQRTRPDFKKNIEVATALGLNMDLLDAYMRSRKLDVFIEDIRSAAVRASAIIRHMLDFSRQSESRRKVCDLPSIIDKAVALAASDYDLKKSYDFKHIKIERDYADDLPVINCTETEIEQVVLNLLRNAAQALAESRPPVEVPRIGITLAATTEAVRIIVADNGPGMPPEVQRRAFEPFFTTKPPGVGTGLGLSVSYFIVTKGHGGRMSVSSSPEAGTVFTIDLPRGAALEA
ncbi:MAG: hypothetical protein AUJ49_11690 [Desulfovibrionaceae bacterium CG1_02_65_16]|nr:MAG: hypothetical protein AUJ49_11690 [Desulfovibrionaceae bacterium CG1_02_65_16]